MESNQKYIEQVGAFLDNELSGDELTSFNEELARNPELAKELNYQQELVEGIKDNRRAELKARLDNVQIGNGLWSGSAVKIFSGVLIVGGIGFGIYQISTPTSITNEDAPELEVKIQDPPTEQPEQIKEVIVPQENENEITEDTSVETQASEPAITAEKEDDSPVEIETPDVPIPEAFDMDNPSEEDLELPETTLGTEEKTIESKIEIEISRVAIYIIVRPDFNKTFVAHSENRKNKQ